MPPEIQEVVVSLCISTGTARSKRDSNGSEREPDAACRCSAGGRLRRPPLNGKSFDGCRLLGYGKDLMRATAILLVMSIVSVGCAASYRPQETGRISVPHCTFRPSSVHRVHQSRVGRRRRGEGFFGTQGHRPFASHKARDS
jgi:hypothetical protein